MKDSVINLLVFLLVFLLVAAVFLANYAFALMLVPGGKGLVFANPFAAALWPALLVGLAAAQFRSIRHPGRFAVTWGLQAAAFFLLIALPLPVLQQMPSVRASDASPLFPDRFLPMEGGALLLASSPKATVLIPSDGPMTVSALTQYDALNQRFVFAESAPLAVGSTGPERTYFAYPDTVMSIQTDFLGLYSILRDNWYQNPLVFWVEAAAITWLFMGIYFFFSFRVNVLIQLILGLILFRLAVWFLVYALWSLPALVELWWPHTDWLRIWGPPGLITVTAATLFFMTLVAKPHRQEGTL